MRSGRDPDEPGPPPEPRRYPAGFGLTMALAQAVYMVALLIALGCGINILLALFGVERPDAFGGPEAQNFYALGGAAAAITAIAARRIIHGLRRRAERRRDDSR